MDTSEFFFRVKCLEKKYGWNAHTIYFVHKNYLTLLWHFAIVCTRTRVYEYVLDALLFPVSVCSTRARLSGQSTTPNRRDCLPATSSLSLSHFSRLSVSLAHQYTQREVHRARYIPNAYTCTLILVIDNDNDDYDNDIVAL